jgi:glyoxylase-like metal-dependent hydrolase (beta-lactamase superfamily II)
MAEILTLVAGHCTHRACMALKGAGLKSQCYPSRAYLIKSKKGYYLWDTGYTEHFIDAARGIYSIYPWVTPVFFETRQSVHNQLKSLGVPVSDIQAVIVSHFHADHIAGLLDFPDVRIICDVEGWQSIQGLNGLSALRHAFLPDLMPADIESRLYFMQSLNLRQLPTALHPFEFGWDLIGDGEIYLVSLPGHARGHIGAFVEGAHGWTLLASDAAWAEEAYTQLRGPSELTFLIQDSRRHYYQTLNKLHRLNQAKEVNIVLTHQPFERS